MKRFLTLFLLLSALPFASVLGQITVYSWGMAPGTGSSQAYSPTKIGADGAWAAFETGSNMSAGIKTDGSLWTCGFNFNGQLGNGTTTANNTLTQVGTEKNWAVISAGFAYFLAIKKDGTLWAWGTNSYGQLGDGTQSERWVPTKIGTATDWVSVKAGQSNSIALKQDGTLYMWGDNGFGQLGKGNSTSTPTLVPTKLNNDTDWASVACGMSGVVAVKNNGELWAWGTNLDGIFGDGTTTNSYVPKRIGTAQDWQVVSFASQHVLALKTNGDLYSWGVNAKGQLGNGGTSNRSSPYLIGSNFNTIGTGLENSSATKKDGTLYTWGADYFGTLANGNSAYSTTAYRATPGQITVGTVKFSGTKYYNASGHAWVMTGANVLSMASTGPLVTNASSVSYTVTFDTSVTGLTTSNFDLDPASTATGASIASVTAVTGNTQWTVVVNTPSTTGTVKLRMNNATGASLNVLNLPYSSTNVYTLDKTAPELSSIIRNTPASALTKATSVIYKVKFNESVTGVDATDFNTVVSGTTPGTITVANGSDASEYLVTVPVTGDGTVQLKLNTTGTGITDLGSNALSGTPPDGEVYTIDQTVPTSVSLVRFSPTAGLTYATTLVYKLTFSENVVGVDETDFVINKSSTVTAGALSVSAGASAAEYFISIPSVSGNGQYSITLKWSNNGIADMAGNVLPSGIAGELYSLDQTPPAITSITRSSPLTQNTNSNTVGFRIKFSESIPVVNLNAFTAVTDGTLAAGSFTLGGISSLEYVIYVPVTGAGTIRLDLKPGNTGMADNAGNPVPGGYTGNETYIVDREQPVVSSIVRYNPSGTLTNLSSVTYKVTFSENVTGVDATDFLTVAGTGLTAGTKTVNNGDNASEYLVTVPVSGSGTLRLDLKASGTGIFDTFGNGVSGAYTTGEVYTIDRTLPAVSNIIRQTPSAGTTNVSSVDYKVTFSEIVSGVDVTDFSVTAGAGVTAGQVTVDPGANNAEYIVSIPVTGNGTVRLDLKASGTGITDQAGNVIATGYTAGQVYTIDQIPPSLNSIVRKIPSAQNTNASSVIYTVTFSEAVSGVDLSDFTATTVSGAITKDALTLNAVSQTIYEVTVPSISGNGTLRLDLNASGTGIVDAGGNVIAAGFNSGDAYLIDQTLPAVSSIVRKTPLAQNTNATLVIYTVTFSEAVSGVDAADFTATTASGSITKGTLTASSISSSVYDITVPAISGNGILRLDLNASGTGINDVAGNTIAAGFTTGNTYLIDQSLPAVSSIVRKTPSAQNTNATSVIYTVTFSEAVTGVDATDFTATTASGTVNKGTLSMTSVSASVYDITVPAISGNGTLRLDLNPSGTGISDAAGNIIAAGFTSGETYLIDQTLPAVTSIVRKTPSAQNTNATSVTYTVAFSESVSGVDATDFTATTASGTVNKGTLSVATVSSSVYDITVPSISGNGTLRLDLNASGTGISDVAGNAIAAGFTTGETYLIDQALPVVSSIVRKTPSAQNTNSTSVIYTVTFSEPVSGVDATDFTATTVSGTLSKGTLTATAVSSSVYDITVPAISGNGTLRLDLNASGTGISDAAGNAIAAGFNTGNTYLIDQTLPVVSSIVRKTPPAQNTNAASVTYTVTFSEAVSGVDATDFTATTVSGTLSKGTLSISAASSSVYDVTVPTISGNGTLRLDLNASGTGISDAADNIIAAGFTSGDTYLVDQTLPIVSSIARKTPSAQNTNATSVTYTITFSEAVSGVDATDFTAATVSGSITKGTLTATAVSSSVYDITVPSISGNGTLRLDLNASGTGISDAAGNVVSGGYTTGSTYLIDQTLPAVSSIVRKTPSVQNTNATSIIYTVTFSEPVSGVDAADFTATTVSGTLSKGTLTATAVSSSVYDITVPSISGNGTLRLDLNASGTGISDAAGNAIAAGFNTGNTYLIDQTLPVVSSIVRKTPSAQNTNATSVIYTVTFSEAVTGVDVTDFAATTVSGTLSKGTLSINAVSSSVYDITVPAISGNGTLRLDLKNSGTGIVDVAGNAIPAGFTAGNTYLVDQTMPAVTGIVRKTPSAQNTNATSVTYTVTFSEAVSGVDATDFTATTVSGTLSQGTPGINAVSSSVYDITVPSISGNGTLRLDLNASGTGITDGSGNVITAAFSTGELYTIDQAKPTISIIRIASDNTNPELAKQGDMVTVSFQVSEELDLNASGAYQIQIGSQQVMVEADEVNTPPEAFWYKASAVMNASEAADGNGNIEIGITGYRDLIGNTGDAKTSTTDASKVMLDTQAPDKPVTPEPPGNGGHVNTTTPTIKGTTEPNATVEILVDGVKVGEAKADGDGKWEYTFDPALTEGEHEIIIRIKDQAGNTGPESDPIKIEVDIKNPDKPVTPAPPGNGGHVNTTTPKINGTTEPNATVEILVDGVKVGEAKADGDGKWEYTFDPALTEGEHEIIIRIKDQAGNTGPESDPIKIEVDTKNPDKPVTPDAPGNGGHVNTTTPTIKGVTEPNATVEILVDGVKVGEAKADGDGNWEYTFDPALTEGEHEITIRIKDPAGNTGPESDPIKIEVDTKNPDKPITPDAPGNGGHVTTTTPTIKGTTEPNATVEILVDGTKVGEAKADGDGNWEYTFDPALTEGEHEITIRIKDPAGNTGPESDPIKIDVDTNNPDKPVTPDAPGNGGHVNTTTPTIKGVTEPNATVEILVDGVKVGETKADGDGKWEYTFDPALTEGEHEITIKVTDQAGNTGAESDPIKIDVDTENPDKPVTPDAPGNGGHVNTTTPTIKGVTEPNATVEVLVDGVKVGEAKADGDGKWEYTFTPALTEGKHEIIVKTRDEAGNSSDPSDPIIINVDVKTPEPPEAPHSNGAGTGTPAISGTTEPNATVEVYVDGVKVGEVKADDKGKWDYNFNPSLSEGKHGITIVVVDPAGNKSEAGAPLVVEVINTIRSTTIQIGAIPSKTYGDVAFGIESRSNSNAPFSYTSSNEHVATIDVSGMIQIHHAGSVTIAVSQPAVTGFTAASASVELVVNKAAQTVSVTPLPELERHGSPYALVVSSSAGLPVDVISSDPRVATISGSSVVPQGIGTAMIILTQPGNEDYLQATAETSVKVTDPSGEVIRVSKVITPNGDGVNDELIIEGLSNVSEHRIVIYNRNGTMLFDSKTYPIGDDYIPQGKFFAGKTYRTGYIPGGTYFYTLEYKYAGVKKLKTGYIVIKY